MIDRVPHLIWSTLPDGYHDFYNRRWYEYIGASPEETRGAGWNDPVHPDDQQRAIDPGQLVAAVHFLARSASLPLRMP